MIRLTLSLLLLPAALIAQNEEAMHQANHFYRHDCAPCHGADGHGNEQLRVPAIAGLPDFYVLQQMQKFRDGLRGTDPNDPHMASMRDNAAALDDEFLMVLGQVIAAQTPRQDPDGALIGDARRGQRLFLNLCSECHGRSAEGNPAKQAPPLYGFQGWYLMDQLKAFKAGSRKADSGNLDSIQMHAMTKRFWRAADLRDVVAYITSQLDGEADAEP